MNAPETIKPINAAHQALLNSEDALCVDAVATATCLKKREAAKQLKELHGLGLIEMEPRAGGVPFYRLIVAPASEINDVAEVGDTDVVELKRLKDVAALKSERDDLRARLDAVTQQSIADTDALTAQIEHLRAELAERDSHLHKITGDTGRSDIAQRLIDHNDDRLYHEADMLMYEVSDAITMLEHERDQLRAELATERQAREALQEQAGDDAVDVKDAAVGYLVRVPKRRPILRSKPEGARSAALAAVRAGAARADVLAVVPVGTARRGAEWRVK